MFKRNLCLVLLVIYSFMDLLRADCDVDFWPFYVSSGYSDLTNCIVFDEVNRIMIVGATSEDTSSNNVLRNKKGFAYALDLEGNWMWSNTFINGTELISEIN